MILNECIIRWIKSSLRRANHVNLPSAFSASPSLTFIYWLQCQQATIVCRLSTRQRHNIMSTCKQDSAKISESNELVIFLTTINYTNNWSSNKLSDFTDKKCFFNKFTPSLIGLGLIFKSFRGLNVMMRWGLILPSASEQIALSGGGAVIELHTAR